MREKVYPATFTRPPAAADDRQLLRVQNLARLLLRVLRPWADGVEPHVREPVPQRAPALSLSLVGERQVVVRVGVLRNQCDGLLVGGGCFGQPLHLVEHIAQIEERERILGVGDGRLAVVLLGLLVLAKVVVDRSELISAGACSGRIARMV